MRVLRRQRRNYADRTIHFLAVDGPRLRFALEAADRNASDALYLVGAPWTATALRGGLEEPLPPGWKHGAHYLRLPHPVLRFDHLDGRTVEMHRAAAYFGEGDYDTIDAHGAWSTLGSLLAGAFDEGHLLATPATTGRYLIGRSVPYGREWPVLSTEAQELLRATSGQGRIQVFTDQTARRAAPTLTQTLSQWDGRFMYAALCDRLPAGEPLPDGIDVYAGYNRPGRYLVRFTVPRDWRDRCVCGMPGHAGIGILPVREPSDAWSWPYAPGQRAQSWADATEVFSALEHGWKVQIQERWLYPTPPYPAVERRNGQATKRGPLDQWAATLVALRQRAFIGSHVRGRELVVNALRAICLDGIGALHGAPSRVTHITSRADAQAGKIPAEAREILPLGPDAFVWTEPAPHAWPEMSHPEWSTTIWARCRARLLSAPAGTGAARVGLLHVPADDVVATFTDSIWLAAAPDWHDDGKVGRFREQWRHEQSQPFQVPASASLLRRFKAEHGAEIL